MLSVNMLTHTSRSYASYDTLYAGIGSLAEEIDIISLSPNI